MTSALVESAADHPRVDAVCCCCRGGRGGGGGEGITAAGAAGARRHHRAAAAATASLAAAAPVGPESSYFRVNNWCGRKLVWGGGGRGEGMSEGGAMQVALKKAGM